MEVPDLDYDDSLKKDTELFAITAIDKIKEFTNLDKGFLVRETGLFLEPEACVRLSLDLYLGFPSDAIAYYYVWAQDYIAGARNYKETYKLWQMLKKEHVDYWNARYHLAKRKGTNETKVEGLYIRMKIVHTCRTVCRMVLNAMDGRDWCMFVPRFLEYRNIGLRDTAIDDFGQGSGRAGIARNLTQKQ